MSETFSAGDKVTWLEPFTTGSRHEGVVENHAGDIIVIIEHSDDTNVDNRRTLHVSQAQPVLVTPASKLPAVEDKPGKHEAE